MSAVSTRNSSSSVLTAIWNKMSVSLELRFFTFFRIVKTTQTRTNRVSFNSLAQSIDTKTFKINLCSHAKFCFISLRNKLSPQWDVQWSLQHLYIFLSNLKIHFLNKKCRPTLTNLMFVWRPYSSSLYNCISIISYKYTVTRDRNHFYFHTLYNEYIFTLKTSGKQLNHA